MTNSSSSSFICTREDLDTIAVYGDVCSLSLENFIHNNGRRDVWSWFSDPKKSSVIFVDDNKYSEDFGQGSYRTLPKSVESLVEKYETAYNAAKNDRTDDRQVKWAVVHSIENEIADALYAVLEPKYKDIDLVEVVASDEPRDGVYDSEDNDEKDMLDSFASLQNPKFYRVYNNH